MGSRRAPCHPWDLKVPPQLFAFVLPCPNAPSCPPKPLPVLPSHLRSLAPLVLMFSDSFWVRPGPLPFCLLGGSFRMRSCICCQGCLDWIGEGLTNMYFQIANLVNCPFLPVGKKSPFSCLCLCSQEWPLPVVYSTSSGQGHHTPRTSGSSCGSDPLPAPSCQSTHR